MVIFDPGRRGSDFAGDIRSASARERTYCHPTSGMEGNMVADRVPTTLACGLADYVKL